MASKLLRRWQGDSRAMHIFWTTTTTTTNACPPPDPIVVRRRLLVGQDRDYDVRVDRRPVGDAGLGFDQHLGLKKKRLAKNFWTLGCSHREYNNREQTPYT